MTTRVSTTRRFTAAAFLAFVLAGDVSPAWGYDMDCKVILCLAAGFPAGCADARAYMLQRLRSLPPKPPFGICNHANPADFQARRGREPLFPCASDFRAVKVRCDDNGTCGCECAAFADSRAAAEQLAMRAEMADGDGYPSAVVLPPSREEDRHQYRIHYECRRRPIPNWLQLRIRERSGRWLVSERYWWH